MIRLPQDLVTQDLGSVELGLAELQTLWLCVGLVVAGFLAVAVRSRRMAAPVQVHLGRSPGWPSSS